MQSLTLHTRVGKDGMLKIETPIGLKDTELDVVLVLNPTGKEAKSWPRVFLKEHSEAFLIFLTEHHKAIMKSGMNLITPNTAEFNRVPGLQLEDWQA